MGAHRGCHTAHRARHGASRGGRLPVSEILAQLASGPGGTAALPAQRSAFTFAAAAAVGVGAAAASVTGTFPTTGALSLPELGDTYFLSGVVEPMPASAPDTALVTAAPNVGRSAAKEGLSGRPTAMIPTLDRVSSSAGAPAGPVMATDLHQSDATEIAALSRAVAMNAAASNPANAPAGSPQAVIAKPDSALNAALSLPSKIGGVPMSGLAANKNAALAVRYAATKLGKPYVWGAVGPDAFDCSGLMLWAYKQAGVSLPRVADAQANAGTPVSKGDLKAGDLVFYYSPVSHVGMYLGNGKILHASEPGAPVKISDLNAYPFHNARRIT